MADNNLDSGKKIIDLFEKKIESQSLTAVGVIGASIFIFVSYYTRTGSAIDLEYEWVIWMSMIILSLSVILGYLSRMSLIACVPSILNYEWGCDDASTANYAGKDVLERMILFQLLAFIIGMTGSTVFFLANARVFIT
ncbi:MAG: hypothetical protein AAFQ55_06825 [Pseudomonadota bacterium]